MVCPSTQPRSFITGQKGDFAMSAGLNGGIPKYRKPIRAIFPPAAPRRRAARRAREDQAGKDASSSHHNRARSLSFPSAASSSAGSPDLGAVGPRRLQIPLLPLQPLRAHRPERLARLAQHGQRILRRADQAGLERAHQREVEQPLGLGADRLRVGARRLELRDERAAVVQEREEPLEEGVGLRSRLVAAFVGMAPSLPESRRVVVASGAVLIPVAVDLGRIPQGPIDPRRAR